MPLPACFQTLFENDPQGFMQGIVHRDRGCVMVDALATPILFNHGKIEIPALNFCFTFSHYLDGPITKRYRREAGRAAKTLLRAAVTGVDLQLIHLDWRAAQ